MENSCIALDVSKGKSYFQGFIRIDKPFSKAKQIEHTKTGFDFMMVTAENLKKEGDVTFIFESTGIYHKGLQKYLDDHEEKYIILNPLEAAKIRKSQLRSTKTDQRDCKNIAVAYFSRDYRIHQRQDDIYERLQQMNRDYGFIVQQLRMLKVAYRNTLDVVYPHFDQLYEDVYSDIAMAVIETNSHPDEILKKRIETLSKQLEKNTKHHKNYCMKQAQAIKTYAQDVQSGVSSNDYEVSELNHYHEATKAQIIEVEIHLEQMIRVSKDIPLFKQLVTIPGIGENLAARLIAEIGDISRFSNKRQLVAYAGIDPRVYQSGQVSGQHLHITKKGNKQLRTLLYLAVSSSLRLKKPSVIRDFYNKKRQQTNPLSHKAALIACANKLLRIIYGMSRNGSTFLI